MIAHTVHIEASPQKVWEVLVDVGGWPRFAPQVRSIERKDAGPLRRGRRAVTNEFERDLPATTDELDAEARPQRPGWLAGAIETGIDVESVSRPC